jgi:hypothetical protein
VPQPHLDVAVKVDANRRAINALGEQTRERFDQTAAGFARNAELIAARHDDR